jgi:hypothetical protein
MRSIDGRGGIVHDLKEIMIKRVAKVKYRIRSREKDDGVYRFSTRKILLFSLENKLRKMVTQSLDPLSEE